MDNKKIVQGLGASSSGMVISMLMLTSLIIRIVSMMMSSSYSASFSVGDFSFESDIVTIISIAFSIIVLIPSIIKVVAANIFVNSCRKEALEDMNITSIKYIRYGFCINAGIMIASAVAVLGTGTYFIAKAGNYIDKFKELFDALVKEYGLNIENSIEINASTIRIVIVVAIIVILVAVGVDLLIQIMGAKSVKAVEMVAENGDASKRISSIYIGLLLFQGFEAAFSMLSSMSGLKSSIVEMTALISIINVLVTAVLYVYVAFGLIKYRNIISQKR